MAINGYENNKYHSASSKNSSLRTIDIDDGSSSRRTIKLKKKKSPYLSSDKVQVISRVTERRLFHKKTSDFMSSFPQASKIYKASSDEFKALKRGTGIKKTKKSVLTLPNESRSLLEPCTVSDMNDSEYYNMDDTPKKRITMQSRKKRQRPKLGGYIRSLQPSNIDLECSSSETIKHGDCKTVSRKPISSQKINKDNLAPHDVWAMLKSMNRFQFNPSPPMSVESVRSSKEVKSVRTRCANPNRRIIETCRTQEISYLAQFDVESTHSQTSIDRITVIENNNNFKLKKLGKLSTTNQSRTKKLNRKSKLAIRQTSQKETPAQNMKSIGYKENKTSFSKNRSNRSNARVFKDSTSIVSSNTNTINKLNRRSDDSGVETLSINYGSNAISSPRGASDKNSSSQQESLGITKVVYSNGRNSQSNSSDVHLRKPRLVTTMPSAAIMPKPNATDIKRKLASLKFPMVILGKDQISSSIEVFNYEPPQFKGLDEHIWPFMTDWYQNSNEMLHGKNRTGIQDGKHNYLIDSSHRKSNYGKSCNTLIRDKINTNDKVPLIKRIPDPRHVGDQVTGELQAGDKKRRESSPKKPKQKDKMLRLLFTNTKASSKIDGDSNRHNMSAANFADVVNDERNYNPVDACTETVVSKEKLIKPQFSTTLSTRSVRMLAKYPWGKTKWASDFIENVMNKINKGVYYTIEQKHNHESRKSKKSDIYIPKDVYIKLEDNKRLEPKISFASGDTNIINKEAAIQVTCPSVKFRFNETPRFENTDSGFLDSQGTSTPTWTLTENNDPLKCIPGFDETLPPFEIESLDMKKIALKHCVTNFMVQFDVALSDKGVKVDVTTSTTCIPLPSNQDKCNANPKIFKCQTTILNAMLPAEICSVLPNIIRRFTNATSTSESSKPFLDSLVVPSEQFRNLKVSAPSVTPFKSLCRYKPVLMPLVTMFMTPELKKMIEGRFNKTDFMWNKKPEVNLKEIKKIKYHILTHPPLLFLSQTFNVEIGTSTFIPNHTVLHQKETVQALNSDTETQSSLCMALVPVNNNDNSSSISHFGGYIQMMMRMLRYHNLSFPSYVEPCKISLDNKCATVGMVLGDINGLEARVSMVISKYQITSILNDVLNKEHMSSCDSNSLTVKCIDNKKESLKVANIHNNLNTRTRLKPYWRLYRKSRSSYKIGMDRRSKTDLSKITNLDDFFRVIGTEKQLSGVFDESAEQKILSALKEMRNWIIEISPKQALLILLLTNKKDTPSLVRFRPILIQGIAVKRITKSIELDMEIEVIERESDNCQSPQYEGISYLLASTENNDNLFEELCWIAKTTASDYQKPFTDASIKLLKSLLEKRKKLNPSYLRVMARYVGLGLLQSPKRNLI